MSESPDSGGESPSTYHTPAKYGPKHYIPAPAPSYSTESPDSSSESPSDNWTRVPPSPIPAPTSAPAVKPVKPKNRRYNL